MVLSASSDAFSAEHTGSILLSLWTWLFHSVDVHLFLGVHLLIRKSAHIAEYAVLSALCFRALRGPARRTWHAPWMLAAIVLPLVVAIADEWHQSFVPSRTSSSRDVLIDLGGASLAQLLIWIVFRWRTRVVPSG